MRIPTNQEIARSALEAAKANGCECGAKRVEIYHLGPTAPVDVVTNIEHHPGCPAYCGPIVARTIT